MRRRTKGSGVLTVLGLVLGVALHPGPAAAQDAQMLFDQGKSALSRRDFVAALEYLFAYLQVDRALLEKHPDFRQAVKENLAWAEGQVRAALEAKRQLDRAGKVVSVEVETGGKFDAPGQQPARVLRPFRSPQGPPPPGRSLGERPPAPAEQAVFRMEPGPSSNAPMSVDRARLSDLSAVQPGGPSDVARKLEVLQERCAALRRDHSELKEAYERLGVRYRELKSEYLALRRRLEP